MKPIKRAAVYLLFALIWVAVAALSAELYGAVHFKRMERNYKAVKEERERVEQTKITDLIQAWSNEKQAKGVSNPSKPPAIAPDFKTQDDNFGDYFLALDDVDRKTYLAFKDIFVAEFDRDGAHTRVWANDIIQRDLNVKADDLRGKKPDAYMSADAAAEAEDAVRRIYEGASLMPVSLADAATLDFVDWMSDGTWHETIPFDGNRQSFSLALYPVTDAFGAVVSVIGLVDRVERYAPGVVTYYMFEVQWFKFRKNYDEGAFRIDNLGWRDDDVVLPKPAGTYRIACMGGSCVAEGATNALTYPNRVEKILNENAPFPVDVVNCGVHALNTANEKRRVFDYLELQPDLLVDYNGQNEFGSLFNKWKQEDHPWIARFKKSKFVNGTLNPLLLPPREKMLADMQAASLDNLKAILEVVRRRHVALAICSFARPDPSRCTSRERDFLDWNTRTFWNDTDIMFASYCIMLDRYNNALKQFCEREGAYYIPVAEELRGGLDYFVDICHMTQDGIAAKSEIIARHLRDIIKKERPGRVAK